MKKVLLTLSAAALLFTGCGEKSEEEKETKKETSQAEADHEKKEEKIEEEILVQHFGASITEEGAITPAEMLQQIEGKDSLQVKLTSTVNAVCQKKGCWMTLEMGEVEDMRVRFKDYEFFVPKDSDGKTAFVEGWAKIDTISVAEQKHYLEDAKAAGEEVSDKEFAEITEPKVTLSFVADGVILKANEEK